LTFWYTISRYLDFSYFFKVIIFIRQRLLILRVTCIYVPSIVYGLTHISLTYGLIPVTLIFLSSHLNMSYII